MDPITRRPTTGYLFTLAGGVISASSKRQHSVILSSTKAKYVAYCQVTKETVWLQLLLKELGHPQLGPTTLSCNNNSAILLANNLKFHARTKHIDTQVHWIREIVKAEQVSFERIPGTEQIANGLTKALDRILFQSFLHRAGMEEI